jgi:CBS domain-containing protein
MDTASDLLKSKQDQLHTINPSQSVLEAIEQMNERRIGAMVVAEGSEVVGIFSERDVLRRVVATGRDPDLTKVGQVMTPRVIHCTTETELEDVRELMDRWQIRHMPVFDQAQGVVGMISLRDLNTWQIRRDHARLEYLTEYVYGRA